MARPRKSKSGRAGTGDSHYRRNRSILLSQTNRCALCGHPGALTADHIVDDKHWPRDLTGKRLPGFDELTNLQAAHGTLGPKSQHNPCPVCGELCNQKKGARVRRRPQSRNWFPDRA